MADRKELLQSNIPRKPKPTQVFRTQVSPTTPSIMGPSPSAGQVSSELVSFLGNLTPTLGKILVERQEQKDIEQRALGIASVKNSNPEQLEKLAKAVREKTISEGESYAFREGVDIAFAQRMTSQYNEELHEEYEKSGVKNDPASGALEAFMDDFDRKFQETHFGKINPEILQDHFYPFAQGIRNQVSQRHTEYQNAVYREKAYNEKQGAFYNYLTGYLPDLSQEIPDFSFSGMGGVRANVTNQQDLYADKIRTHNIIRKVMQLDTTPFKLSSEDRDFLIKSGKDGAHIVELYEWKIRQLNRQKTQNGQKNK